MLSKITVDLNSKVISDNQKIWVVHHGRNANYFDEFKREGAVFLEFPGLSLNQATAADDSAIRQRLRYAQAIRSNKALQRANGTPILIRDFSGKPGRDVSVHLRTVKHLVERMEVGDLVMVPGRGAGGRVLFGEVAGGFFPQRVVRAPGLQYADTPVRSVNWLQERVKGELPAQLVKYFEKPPAIAEVGRDAITERFFDYAYDAYSTRRVSWVSLDAPAYDGRDFLSLVPPAQLLALAVSIYRAMEANADLTGLSYEDIVAAYYDRAALQDAQLRFASPGRYNLRDYDARLAQFINVFVALALAGSLAACSVPGTVETENSKAPDDPAVQDVQLMIERAGQSAGGDVLAKADKQGLEAKANIKLKTPASVK